MRRWCSSTGGYPPAPSVSTSRSAFPVVGLPRRARSGHPRRCSRRVFPSRVAVGAVQIAENDAGSSVAAFSSRGLAFGGGLKPELVAPGVAVPTSEPGRGEDGDVRYGTVSGTSAAAAVTAGAAAVLAQGRPQLRRARAGRAAHGLRAEARSRRCRVGSGPARPPHGGAAGDRRRPATVSFGVPGRSFVELERTLEIHNVSTRGLTVSIQTLALAPKGVELTIEPRRLRIGPGGTAIRAVCRADTSALSEQAGAATGELVLAVSESSEVHVPWAVAVPAPGTRPAHARVARDRRGRSRLRRDACRARPRGRSARPDAGPQVRPLDVLEVQLRRRTASSSACSPDGARFCPAGTRSGSRAGAGRGAAPPGELRREDRRPSRRRHPPAVEDVPYRVR